MLLRASRPSLEVFGTCPDIYHLIRYLCLPPTYLVSVPSKEGDAVIGFVRHLIYPESRKNRCLRRRAICRVPTSELGIDSTGGRAGEMCQPSV